MSLSTEINKKPAETIVDRKRIMGFGRYKDLTIEEILQIDPQYLLWCQENIPQFDLDHKLLSEAEQDEEGVRRENLNMEFQHFKD